MAEQNANVGSNGPHPLQFRWVLWHDFASLRTKQTNFALNLRPIAKFDTIEDFWALFNNLKEPSKLAQGHTYNLFKEGIEPKWEDPANENGGEWRVTVPGSRKNVLDQLWINSAITVIGEGFEPLQSDDITGIVVNLKRGNDRIAIWTKSASEGELQKSLGKQWKTTTNITMRMEYISFQDALKSKNPRSRSKYSIEP